MEIAGSLSCAQDFGRFFAETISHRRFWGRETPCNCLFWFFAVKTHGEVVLMIILWSRRRSSAGEEDESCGNQARIYPDSVVYVVLYGRRVLTQGVGERSCCISQSSSTNTLYTVYMWILHSFRVFRFRQHRFLEFFSRNTSPRGQISSSSKIVAKPCPPLPVIDHSVRQVCWISRCLRSLRTSVSDDSPLPRSASATGNR